MQNGFFGTHFGIYSVTDIETHNPIEIEYRAAMSKHFAVILVNLATPESPDKKAVGNFLKAFLSDPRVIEAPAWFWQPLLRGLIVPLRAKKSAQAYRKIWWSEGSPLKVISGRQVQMVQKVMTERLGDFAPVVAEASTYGRPSIEEQMKNLIAEGVQSFVIIPMYPQYSSTTTGAVWDQVSRFIKETRDVPELTLVKSFYQRKDYIAALAESVQDFWQNNGRKQKLLMSFHGIPQAYADKGDPYPEHCRATAESLAKALALKDDDWAYSFQSRFGPKQWVKPYTEETLKAWGAAGLESVDVVSPAFTVDCLETLEELNMENRDLFINSGGKEYAYIPCLNDRKTFVDMLANLIQDRIY